MTVAWAPPLRFRRCPNGSATRRDSSRSNDQRVRGILRDSGVERHRGCGRSTSPARCRRGSWSATIGPVGVVRQNADKRTRAQVHGDEVHFIAAC